MSGFDDECCQLTMSSDYAAYFSNIRRNLMGQHLFPSTKLTCIRHFWKMEEVLNGYVTNPNPIPTPTPNPNSVTKIMK
jgi:hypothetical protein